MTIGQVTAAPEAIQRTLPIRAVQSTDRSVIGIALGEQLAQSLDAAMQRLALSFRLIEARAASPASLGSARVILVGQSIAEAHHDLVASIRQSAPAAAVLLVADPGDDFATVLGLELGADAFVRADEGCRVLMSQIRAMLRQSARWRAGAAGAGGNRIQLGRSILDHDNFGVVIDGDCHALPVAQFALLWALAGHPGRVVERSELANRIHAASGCRYPRQVDTVVCRLRERLDDINAGLRVRTVRGAGYLLSVLS